jgi:Domain of unknown function (DUF6285)
MNDRPNATELIDAVRGFLEADLLPALTDARLRFHALVAANVLAIALRELHGEEASLREEWQSLAPLLGEAGEPPRSLAELRAGVRGLNERLCTAIRSGACDGERFAQAADVLRLLVVRKLEVANPRHLESLRPPSGG